MITIKRAPSILTAAVLAVLVTLSVVAWWVIHNGVDRQNQELLNQDTSQAALLLQGNVEHTSILLGSVGVEPKVFDKQAEAIRTSPAVTVALVSKGRVNARGDIIAPGPPQVDVAVGPALHPGPLTGKLASIALAARSTLSGSPVIHVAGRPFEVLSIVPPSIGIPGYVALEMSEITPGRAANTNGPYNQVDVALYATPTPQPAELVASTIGRNPLPQPTASAELTLGTLKWDVVGAAKAPLLGSVAQATPWIVLGVGLLLALGLAITVETLIRLYRQQRTVLGNVQRALLPKGLPDVPGFEFAARYVPARRGVEIGGDWYSIVRIDDDRFAVVIGDVTGHGIDAAAVMARVRYTIRVLAGLGFPAEEVLERTSRELDMDDGDQFATAAVCVVDRSAQLLTVASAGHLPPLLITGGQAEFVKIEPGEPLGLSGPAPVPSSISFAPGSTIVAYTDGLVERRGEAIDRSLERLADAAAQSPPHPEQLIEHLLTALVGTHHEDDIAVIAVRAL